MRPAHPFLEKGVDDEGLKRNIALSARLRPHSLLSHGLLHFSQNLDGSPDDPGLTKREV